MNILLEQLLGLAIQVFHETGLVSGALCVETGGSSHFGACRPNGCKGPIGATHLLPDSWVCIVESFLDTLLNNIQLGLALVMALLRQQRLEPARSIGSWLNVLVLAGICDMLHQTGRVCDAGNDEIHGRVGHL